jgi:acyl carrier protein
MTPESPTAIRIRTALAEYLKREAGSIQLQQSLRDDLGLDSMATIELLFRIEEVFDIQIPDEDLRGLATVGDVTAYVEKRLHKAGSKSPRKKKS